MSAHPHGVRGRNAGARQLGSTVPGCPQPRRRRPRRSPSGSRWREAGGLAVALVLAAVLAGCAEAADGPSIEASDGRAAPETTERTTTTEPSTTTTTEPSTTTSTTEPSTTTTTEPSTTTTEEEAPASTAPDTGGTSAGDQDVYAIGQWAHTGDFDVTVHQVVDPYVSTNELETPQPGHRFVAVEVELRNTSDEVQTFSSLLGAEVTDSLNRPWDIGLAGFDLPQVDGDVPPGGARRGWMVFEVAEDSTGLLLRIKGNLTATGSLFALG